jgi:hypothetical protein
MSRGWTAPYRRRPRWKVTVPAHATLRYSDDQTQIDFETELWVDPRRTVVYVRELPADLHISRNELLSRIARKYARRGLRVVFIDLLALEEIKLDDTDVP